VLANPGTGKTHLVCALGFSACAQGRNVRFHTAADLVTPLVECREEKRLQRLHKQLQRPHLLVIDELGYVPFSKARAELLFEVISRADEHHSLMVTTNLAFEEWTEIFGSERPTGALLDRLTHRCHILEVNGDSYRLRQAWKRSNWKPSIRQDSTQES
jgi:DNA replication protein DnaC